MGTVIAVRHAKPARCRVKLGDNTTDWLPWLAGRAAGKDGSTWWPPIVGEQCLVVATGGDLAQGVVLLGAYSDHMDAPADAARVEFKRWSATEFAEYRDGRRTIHTEEAIVLEVGDGCSIAMATDSITLRVGGAVLHIGPDQITSSVDIVAAGISTVHHKHGGVRQGLDTSGEPQ